MDPCTITQAAREQLGILGADTKNLQQKFDLLAKEANRDMDLLGAPIVRQLLTDLTNAVGSTMTGVISQMSQQLASSINQTVNLTGGMLALITMVASSGTQVQLLLISQLKRELTIRVSLYKILLYHYTNIYRILKNLQSPQSTSYRKLMAALPYVRRAEAQLGRIILAESTGGLPAKFSYRVLRNAFYNIELAVRILSLDASRGGKDLGNALALAITGKPVSKKRWETLGKAVAKDLIFKSIATSLSYIEHLSWHYMRIASTIPIPFEAVDSIFQPNNYTSTFLKNNGITDVGVKPLNETEQDQALASYRDAVLSNENRTLIETGAKIISSIDLLKGIVPTNIIINSLIDAIINFPSFSSDLSVATSNLMVSLLPIANTVQTVREGMEDSLEKQDSDIVLAGKEGLWLMKLNTVLMLKNGILPAFEGQAQLNNDAYKMEDLITYLKENVGVFVIAESMPKLIVQSLEILRAPFNRRSLEESIVLVSFIIKQLQRAILIDRQMIQKASSFSAPLAQFTQLLDTASKLPAPISTVSNALMNGQAQTVLGFVSSLTLGTMDSVASLLPTNCPEIKSTEELELTTYDSLNSTIDEYEGIGVA